MSMTLKLEHRERPQGAVQWESADGRRGGIVHRREDVPEDSAMVLIPPCEWFREWIGDVAQVTVHGQVHPDEMVSVEGPVDQHHPDQTWHSKWHERWPWLIESVELHTWMGDEVKAQRTMLSVSFTNGAEARWMLVERAWLLSDSGSTIERIAP